jgi:hypothetical protein
LALGLQHVGLGRDAGVVAVGGDLQAALIALDRGLDHGDLGVGAAQTQIAHGQLALGR